VLAVPLLVWGAAGLWLSARWDRDRDRRRGLLRSALLAGGLGVVLWIPTVLDVLLHEGSNARRIVDWFRNSGSAAHSPMDGLNVVLGQFGLPPEWLTSKRLAVGMGESAFLYASPPPVLLVPAALAAWTLWRRRRPDGPRLVLTLGLALLVSVAAVARTPGPVLDYRLRSTWMPAMVAFAATAWAGWAVIAGRSPRAERRWLVPGALVALAGLGALNTATVALDVPHENGSAAVRSLTSQLGLALADDDLARGDGAIVVTRPPGEKDWITAALVLQLERQGIDARVPSADASAVGRHRVLADGSVKAQLVVVTDEAVDRLQPTRGVVSWPGGRPISSSATGPDRDATSRTRCRRPMESATTGSPSSSAVRPSDTESPGTTRRPDSCSSPATPHPHSRSPSSSRNRLAPRLGDGSDRLAERPPCVSPRRRSSGSRHARRASVRGRACRPAGGRRPQPSPSPARGGCCRG
jgi:hypothetical protein